MSPWVQLFYLALDTPHGIIVECEEPVRALTYLNTARNKHGDPALKRVSVTRTEDQPNWLYLLTCLEEKPSPSSESMSSSTPPTPNGSSPHTVIGLALPKPSE